MSNIGEESENDDVLELSVPDGNGSILRLNHDSSSWEITGKDNISSARGFEKIEDRVRQRLTKIIKEEISKVCLGCGQDKFYDSTSGVYYCPRCE